MCAEAWRYGKMCCNLGRLGLLAWAILATCLGLELSCNCYEQRLAFLKRLDLGYKTFSCCKA